MKRNARDAIIDAAVYLFNHKGFKGTSVRDIGDKAETNSANIAYYFGNKEGLLEYCFTKYYEGYLREMEKGVASLEDGAVSCLKKTLEKIMLYQFDNSQLTRMIVREMSLDSQMVREIMSTYAMKEKYFFQLIFEHGFANGEFRRESSGYYLLQLKGLLTMPFLNTHYMTEVLYLLPQEKYFADKYLQELYSWVDGRMNSQHQDKKMLTV
ncbi:forespore capture DNA-binding protein RefZ [Cytobacillus gottheilii]|uniref:forespore capture DNA-binding protein RefZ n=1 Tax=Cytobacillus gottheilii TaxID=859144 RepID=UPI0009B9C8E5|nr:forespore capture DNA-binding protein RefZ [Cytobacillus gottheilii]